MLLHVNKLVDGEEVPVVVSSSDPMPITIVGGGADLTLLIVEDSLGVKYLRREVINELGVITITYENFDNTPATPTPPITLASSVLPVGASTATNQTTLITNFGAVADAVASTDTGSFSLISLIKRGMQNWTSLLAKFSATSNSDVDRLPVSQLDGLAVSGTATSAAVLFTTSMLGYESITVQVISAGTSCTITYETSDDNTNWVSCGGLLVTATGAGASSTTTTAAGAIQFSRKCRYFRARVSTYGSGTITVAGTLSKAPANTVMPATYGAYSEAATLGSGLFPSAVESRTSSKTSVTSGAAVRPIATQDGRQIIRSNSIPENEWMYAAASGGITNTTDVVLIAAQGANIKNYLTSMSVANPSNTASEIVIKDGASTVIWRGYLTALEPLKHFTFNTPLQSTANTALNVACITTGTQTYVSAQGYKAP